jgi:iron complex transport system ATP-binding protein
MTGNRTTHDNAAPALEARGVSATLGMAEVLHDIDLKLAAGRWTSIVGPNGAGKSTLLKAMAGPARAPRRGFSVR